MSTLARLAGHAFYIYSKLEWEQVSCTSWNGHHLVLQIWSTRATAHILESGLICLLSLCFTGYGACSYVLGRRVGCSPIHYMSFLRGGIYSRGQNIGEELQFLWEIAHCGSFSGGLLLGLAECCFGGGGYGRWGIIPWGFDIVLGFWAFQISWGAKSVF